MGLLIFMQVVLDLGFIAATTWLLIDRSKSKTMEDPRLSRGLQLLSSKIAILQDLMDRSEAMSKQLNQLIDGKQADIQERIEEFEIYLHKIQSATEKSQQVVDIFQERVPHREMIERQTAEKYLVAAKLANQGVSVDEIARQVEIPRGELELICKVNRDRLIAEETDIKIVANEFTMSTVKTTAAVMQAPTEAPLSVGNFGESARANAGSSASSAAANVASLAAQAAQAANSIVTAAQAPAPSPMPVPARQQAAAPTAPKKPEKEIRPVIFKRISVLDDLG